MRSARRFSGGPDNKTRETGDPERFKEAKITSTMSKTEQETRKAFLQA